MSGYQVTVAPTEIDRQRSLGWPDFHPEDHCHRCGQRNVCSWHAPDEVWNLLRAAGVLPDSDIVCPQCFTELAREHGVAPSVWHLVDGDQARLCGAPTMRTAQPVRSARRAVTGALLRQALVALLATGAGAFGVVRSRPQRTVPAEVPGVLTVPLPRHGASLVLRLTGAGRPTVTERAAS